MQNLVTPRAAFLADVPPGERTPREDMINAANSYFEAIEHGDGEIAPFAEDCERHENGGQTTHNATPVPWPVPMGSPEADHAMAILGTLTCTPNSTARFELHHPAVAAALGWWMNRRDWFIRFRCFSIEARCMTSRSKACPAWI